MGLVRLGSYISQSELRNSEGKYDGTAVVGLSTGKQLIQTKADLEGVGLSSYKLLPPKHFGFVPDTSRRGDKAALGYNNTDHVYLISSIYTVFFTDAEKLSADYLYLYFNRSEFDRYARFHSWGSVREMFTWEDMCDVQIDLPPLATQQKYVNVYKAMLANLSAQVNSLKNVATALKVSVERLGREAPRTAIGNLLEEIDVRNSDGAIKNVQGININKEFMPTAANLSEIDLTKYKVVRKNQFAANFMHVLRDQKIPFGLYSKNEPCIVSPAYPVFQVKSDETLPEYIMMWLNRAESDRYAWFVSDSSVRGGLEMSRFFGIEIPLPPLPQQKAVANLYNAKRLMQRNMTTLGGILKDICPILIKGAQKESAGTHGSAR